MEERLQAILSRIEQSSLSEEDKIKLYGIISESMKAAIWPALVSRMPKEKISSLEQAKGKDAVYSYIALIEEATKDETALDEINTTLSGLLDEIDAALKAEHI